MDATALGSLVGSIIMAAIMIFALLTGFAYMTLIERKVVGRMQVRLGPNRVGPFGSLQPLADAIKLLFKEDIVPTKADRPVFTLAPIISLTVALAAFAVIPFGNSITIHMFGQSLFIPLRLADVNVGILYVFGITSLGVYGIVLAGWSSNNKYALLGGIRASAQVISYELALGMAIIGPILLTHGHAADGSVLQSGSLTLNDIVRQQQGVWLGFIPKWNIFLQPVAFIIYTLSAIAEVNRAPFDLPEAETELVAGYHIEYSSMRWSMFFMAEYINMFTVSAIAATVFLGGWSGWNFIGGFPWFFIKISFFMFVFIWLRATLPRLRYDRLMKFGWHVLLPLSLLNLAVTAAVIVIGNF